MNKISLYFLLILIYLGLSKSFAPSEQATPYIPSEHAIQHYFPGAPVSVILTDAFKTGFIIHTYFHRYTVIHVFKPPEEVYVRTSESFWSKHLDYIGMSILRRDEKTNQASLTPLPPGLIFVGDPAYGAWEYHNSGQKVWQFHNAYQSFPELLGWEDFLMTEEVLNAALIHLKNDKPYFGPAKEFGSDGKITQKVYNWSSSSGPSFKDTLANFWSSLKTSFSLGQISKKDVKPVSKKRDIRDSRPSSTLDQIPVEKIGSQLGEQKSTDNKNKDDQSSSLLEKLPLGEERNE